MKEHILERIAELRRLSDAIQQGGRSDAANSVVNSLLDAFLDIRDLARTELVGCYGVNPETPKTGSPSACGATAPRSLSSR